MVHFEHLLVLTDYSDCSRAALQAALDLAETLGARVELVHVWPAPFFGPEYDQLTVGDGRQSLFDRVREQATDEMQQFVASVVTPHGVQLTTRIESGEPVRRLLEIIESSAPDLVIVGTHGRTGPRRWVLGSLAERLVQLSPSPVLTVPLAGTGQESER
jgi:nucleotide-binding universal stress UspA family protein